MASTRVPAVAPVLYAVVRDGQSLAKVVWTENRELAEDMLRGCAATDAATLWVARRIAAAPPDGRTDVD